MGNNPVPKFIFRFSRFPVYRGSVLGRFYCILVHVEVADLKVVVGKFMRVFVARRDLAFS